jgi:predicted nucleic acid-binding Zn ribbon protein
MKNNVVLHPATILQKERQRHERGNLLFAIGLILATIALCCIPMIG